MNKRLIFVVCLLALFCFPVWLSFDFEKIEASNHGSVHNITTGQNYTTIQGAINDANYGNTIIVESGVYNEDVVANQTVTLIGEDRHNTIVNGSGNAPVFYIQRDDVVISNFTMQNNNMFTWAGVYFGSYRSNSNVSRNIIRNCSVGIRCWEYSEGNFIEDNEIVDCRTGVKDRFSSGNMIIGNSISLCSDYAVDVEGSDDTIVQGNTISQCTGGIFLSFGSQRTVINSNYISNGTGGIGLDASSRNVITNNRIEHCNLSGIYVGEALWTGSNYNTVTNNTISFSTKGEGLFIYGSTGNNLSGNTMMNNLYNFGVDGEELSDFINYVDISNTVEDNPVYYWINEVDATIPPDAGYVGLVNSTGITIRNLTLSNNWQGILLAFASDSEVIGNIVIENNKGITLYGNSSDNKIYLNYFIDNIEQAYIALEYGNFWNETYPIGGNYWSDYTDVDDYGGPLQDETGADGFWDNPYVIDDYNQDNHPIVPEFQSLITLSLFLLAIASTILVYGRKQSKS